MCTAISFLTKDHYFGRNLDLEYSYRESVTITPRNYCFHFRLLDSINNHYAMIGMATIADNYPLYYEATNEFGLSAAGLNFPGNAMYHSPIDKKVNVASFELIPWILGQCKSVSQVQTMIKDLNIVNIPFSNAFPPTPLHWIICDRKESIVLEPMESGIKVFNNPVGVLTNNPPFDYHIYNLSNHMNLTSEEPSNRFAKEIELTPYSRGMGAIGMPGDLSSSSRFVRATFTKLNAVCENNEVSSISQFFHILGSVAQQRGCVKIEDKLEKTIYTSCCNTDKGIYYYTTYENSQITAIRLWSVELDSNKLFSYPLIWEQQIRFEN